MVNNKNKEVNPKKIKEVETIKEKVKNSKTILAADIKGLPSKQFQEIRKKLRGIAEIKIAKVNIIKRAIDEASVGAKKLEPFIKEDTAVLFSEVDAFELSGILSENKTPAKAKAGDIAPEDIVIEAGPTELVPGPVISELGGLGLKIAVEDGKITIKENKVIVKFGEKVSENAASLMQKLDIKPFSIGIIPIAAYDNKEKMLYENIKIDKEATLKEIKESHARAFAFSIKLAYACKETISMLLRKASLEYNKLSSLINVQENSQEEN